MKRLLSIYALALVVVTPASARLTVLVTIAPHASLVEQLGGEAVSVIVVLAPGESPATYDPTARQLERLAAARIWFTTGAPLEPSLIPRLEALAPELQTVPTHAGIVLLASDGDHGVGGDHDHGDTDPHVWLSARNTVLQIEVMAATLVEYLPDHREAIARRRDHLVKLLRDLDSELGDLLAPFRGSTIFVFHPAFAYFLDDYGLRQSAVERGGLAPSPRHLAEVLGEIHDQGAHTIFIQPQYSDHVVDSLAREADLSVVVLDPLAPDHLANLWRLGETIATGLEARP